MCELAKEMILPQLSTTGWQLQEVEIAESDELVARYGIRIPVVAKGEQELGWPFNEQHLEDFLRTA